MTDDRPAFYYEIPDPYGKSGSVQISKTRATSRKEAREKLSRVYKQFRIFLEVPMSTTFPPKSAGPNPKGSASAASPFGGFAKDIDGMVPLRLIFLDLDGVIVPLLETEKKMRPAFPKQEAVDLLNEITLATGAGLVLTTSWRTSSKPEALEKLFAKWGILAPIVGATPELAGVERSDEVRAWLAAYCTETKSSYVVVDDEWEAGIPEHFMRTDGRLGLCREDADWIVRHLLKENQ